MPNACRPPPTFDLGDAPRAIDLPRHRLTEELTKRGLKASGFPDDDARRLQVKLDAEWVTTRADRLVAAQEAYKRECIQEAIMAAKMFEGRQGREEVEALASDSNASALLALIRANATPPTLNLRNIAPPAARALVAAIGGNTSVRTLDLNGCNLSDVQVSKALGAMLAHNTTLQRLDLDWNALNSGGLYCLAQGLAANRTLVSLSLEGNRLCVRGEGGSPEGLYTHLEEQVEGGDATVFSSSIPALAPAPAPATAPAPASSTAAAAAAAAPHPSGPVAVGASEFSGLTALCQALATHPTLAHLNLFETGLGPIGGGLLAKAVASGPPGVLLTVQYSPLDGLEEGSTATIAQVTGASREVVRAAREEELMREAIRVRDAEAELERTAKEREAALAGEWAFGEAEKRRLDREEAEKVRLKGEIVARAARAQEYKEYLVHKAANAEVKAAKEKAKK